MYIFLCYSSQDKLAARTLYNRLSVYTWLRTWFEFGTHQNTEEVVENSNSVIILLSRQSIAKKGYEEEQVVKVLHRIKEIIEQGKKRILVLPIRLDECTIPDHLQYLPWKDYFSATAFEELINSFWVHQYEFTGPAIYAIGDKPVSKDPNQFPVENPAEFYEKIDWHTYITIPASSELNYSFSIRKFQITTEQYFRFLQSDDYADKQYWTNFPKYDQNCKYIGDWGNDGLDWLQQVLKRNPSLLEKRLGWKWYFPNTGPSYDFRQPNHPVVQITWFEANAYCKWLSAHWRELPESKSILSLGTPNENLIFRLPLEKEMRTALTYDDGTRVKTDPTGRQHTDNPGIPPGIPIDFSERDMLANLYSENIKDSRLAYFWGEYFIDELSRENYRLWDRGSFRPQDDYEELAFRAVIAE